MRNLDKAAFYAPNPDECRAIAPHFARGANWIEEHLKIPEVVHDGIINSYELTDMCYVILGYLHRIGILDKFIPWISSSAEKVRNDLGRAEENISGHSEAVPAAVDALNGRHDVDPTTIPGIGAQYSAD